MYPTFTAVALASLLATAPCLAQATENSTVPAIHWFPCPENASLPLTCGNLTVPLDYTNLDSGQYLNLSLIKVNATKEPFLGSILMNPGGPGLLGRSMFIGGPDDPFLTWTGGQFDLISFDTRGTGVTIPYSCQNATDAGILNLAMPRSSNASDTAVGTIMALQDVYAQRCLQAQNETGDLVGTAFVARDMMKIVDALNEDGLLRYWGFSYGTALGATVAAMFPERMGRVVIDGVLNMHEYYAGKDFQQAAGSDRAFRSFLQGCAAAPGQCALASEGVTADTLAADLGQLLDTLKYLPLSLGPEITDVIDYASLKNLIVQGLREPFTGWPALAEVFQAALIRNVTMWRESSAFLYGVISLEGGVFPNYGLDAYAGIRCSDVTLRSNNLSTLQPIVDEFESTSLWTGDIFPVQQALLCSQWKIDAKGRYEGNFQVTTRYPMLIVGSPLDHLTSIGAARNVSADFAGSVVLQHNGNGHCSIAQPSTCTIRTIQDYFVNGTLPAPGSQCYPDEPVFSNSSSSDTTSRMHRRSLEQDGTAELLEAANEIRKRFGYQSTWSYN